MPQPPELLLQNTDGSTIKISAPITIGRKGGGADLQFDEPTASKIHARILFHNGMWVIKDMGSRNGVYVNGKKLPENKARAIQQTDKIQIGKVVLRNITGEDENKTDILPAVHVSNNGWLMIAPIAVISLFILCYLVFLRSSWEEKNSNLIMQMSQDIAGDADLDSAEKQLKELRKLIEDRELTDKKHQTAVEKAELAVQSLSNKENERKIAELTRRNEESARIQREAEIMRRNRESKITQPRIANHTSPLSSKTCKVQGVMYLVRNDQSAVSIKNQGVLLFAENDNVLNIFEDFKSGVSAYNTAVSKYNKDKKSLNNLKAMEKVYVAKGEVAEYMTKHSNMLFSLQNQLNEIKKLLQKPKLASNKLMDIAKSIEMKSVLRLNEAVQKAKSRNLDDDLIATVREVTASEIASEPKDMKGNIIYVTMSNSKGAFSFPVVKPGKYILFSSFRYMGNNIFIIRSVTTNGNDIELELSNKDAIMITTVD